MEVSSRGVAHGTMMLNITNDSPVIALVILFPRWGNVDTSRYPAVRMNFCQIEKLVVNQDDRVP